MGSLLLQHTERGGQLHHSYQKPTITAQQFCHKNCLNQKNLLFDVPTFLTPKFQAHEHPLQCITLASELSPGYIARDPTGCAEAFPPVSMEWEDTSGPWEHPASCPRCSSRDSHAAGQPGHASSQHQQGRGGSPWCAVRRHRAVATTGTMPAASVSHLLMLTRLLQDCTHVNIPTARPKVGHEGPVRSARSANASWIPPTLLTSSSWPLPRGRSRRNVPTVFLCSLSKFSLVNIFILLWNLEIQHYYSRVALQLFVEGILVHSYVAPKKSQLSYAVRSFSYFPYRSMWINSGKAFSKEKRKAPFLPRLAQKGLGRVYPHHCLPTVPFHRPAARH